MAKVQFKKRAETNYLIVHCAATRPSQNVGVREIRQWHKERGFLDIGYHFVIRRDGTLENGRDVSVVGAHVAGQNHDSVGICLVGGVNDKMQPEANFTPAQMHTLKEVLAGLQKEFPLAVIKGHHDFAAKACPSFDVKRWLSKGELVTSDRG